MQKNFDKNIRYRIQYLLSHTFAQWCKSQVSTMNTKWAEHREICDYEIYFSMSHATYPPSWRRQVFNPSPLPLLIPCFECPVAPKPRAPTRRDPWRGKKQKTLKKRMTHVIIARGSILCIQPPNLGNSVLLSVTNCCHGLVLSPRRNSQATKKHILWPSLSKEAWRISAAYGPRRLFSSREYLLRGVWGGGRRAKNFDILLNLAGQVSEVNGRNCCCYKSSSG